jgi:hypothetical protein
MTTLLDDDNYLRIKLISYDKPTELKDRFYFLEMSTLQATTLIPNTRKIISSKIVAYTDNNEFLDDIIIKSFKTIGDFNKFFELNPEYYIHNCNIQLENEVGISSHDDGEVSIQFPSDQPDQIAIDNICEKYKLDKKLIAIIKSKPGHYIAIDQNCNITGDFVDFDDYLENGRK